MPLPLVRRPTRKAFFLSPRAWLVLLLLTAWGMRLYHLGEMSLWWDESLSWDRALQDLPTILSNTIHIQSIVTQDLHPPLYFVLLHFAVLLAGTTEFALRFLSTGANLLTLALCYPLARLVLGRRGRAIGLLTALFGAISPFYVWYSQEARPYALVLLWSTLAVYALLQWLGVGHAHRDTTPGSARWAVVWALAFAATLTTHYLSFVFLPFFAVILLLHGRGPLRARLTSRRALLAVVLLAAFGAILVILPRGDELASWDQVGPRFVPFFIMLRDVWNSFAVGLTANLDDAALLDLTLVALWLIGLFSTVRAGSREGRVALWLFAYLVVPALALQIGSLVRPLYLNSRHLITTSPAFYLGLALGVDALARRAARLVDRRVPRYTAGRAAYLSVALLAALPVLAGSRFALDNLYFNPAFAKDDHKAWAQYLRERLRPGDYLFLVAPQAEKIVKYYAPPGLEWESLPHLGQTQDWQQFLDRESVVQAYRQHDRVWFLEIHQPVGDPKRAINNILFKYGDSVGFAFFRGISTRIILQQFVYRSPVIPSGTPVPNPTDIVYDGNLKLLGLAAPQTIEAGTRATIQLYWQLVAKTSNDVTVSVRVVNAQGEVWGQWDAPPVGNAYPLSKWQARATYLDRHDLVVDPGAPPGHYTVELNMYRATGHAPLAARLTNGDETTKPVRLAEIEVTPPATPLNPRDLLMDHHANVALNAVDFVGYDLEDPATSPGGELPLTLYFQVRQTEENASGQVEVAAPWWRFWDRARAVTPFTLELAGRRAGDIVQARVNARVPGDATAGEYALGLTLDGQVPAVGFLPGRELTFGAAQVQALTRSTDLPSISHPLSARLGEGAEFLGYAVDREGPFQPGEHIGLTLYWRGRQTMPTSYKVFVHLIDANNRIFGQQDALPLDGARPTTSWAPGEVLADRYEFDVAADAPPGLYQIEIGMYNPDNLRRVPAFDDAGRPSGDRILLGEVRLQ